jgi:hypothetical protein
MELKRSTALVLMASLGAVLFAWSHAQSKAYTAVASTSREAVQNRDTNLILAGAPVPMVTTPIIGRNLNLAVPLYEPVTQGEVIGTGMEEPQGSGR